MFDLTEEDTKRIAGSTFLFCVLIAREPRRLFMESYVDTLMNLHKCGIKYRQMELGGCSDLSYGRNLTAARFLSSECTDLILIDDDITWKSEDIMRLIGSEHDVISGVYRRKLYEYDEDNTLSWAFDPLPPEETEIDRRGARTIRKNGLGFIKITRACLEKIIAEKTPPSRYDESAKGKLYRFFYFDGLGLSEDYHFCETWRSIGGKVWADPKIRLGHVGEHAYVGDPNKIFNKGQRYFNISKGA